MPILKNARHERFAQAVAQGKTADEAYVLAGYQESGKNAQRLRKNEGVAGRIEEILRVAAEKSGATVERIAQELERIAFADITEAVEWGDAVAVQDRDGGSSMLQAVILKPSTELPKRVTAAIAEVAKTKEGIRVKFHDKMSALEKLGKHLGMFKEKIEHSGTVTLESLVGASMQDKTGEKS